MRSIKMIFFSFKEQNVSSTDILVHKDAAQWFVAVFVNQVKYVQRADNQQIFWTAVFLRGMHIVRQEEPLK